MGKSSRNNNKATKEALDDGSNSDSNPIGGERFAAAETRPQFRVPKANASKVVLDDRFSSVLTDSRFQLQEMDKYGRKNKKKSGRNAAKEELESFYVVENQEEKSNSDDDNSNNDAKHPEIEENKKSNESDSDAETSVDEKPMDSVSRIAYLTAFSRGQTGAESSSEDDDSSDSSDDDDDSDEDSVYGTPGILDPSTKQDEELEITYDLSPYLVVTNMDWENIRAVDLFSILSSFAPPGAIKKVQVFQSDFGMEQMSKDKLHGPTGIWQKQKMSKEKVLLEGHSSDVSDSDEEDSGSEESSEVKLNFHQQNVSNESDYDPEKLRAYEASKLKYFFAVTEVTKPEYADIIYREVDGMEFEHSSTAIDLRTLPTEALESVITDRPMRDEATSIPGKYDPPEFVVSALQQTNVQCTWDQGDKEREKKLTNYGSSNWQESFEQDDLKAYLASDGSSDDDSDEEDDKKADKKSLMRKALGLESDSDNDSDNDSGEDSRSKISDGDEDDDEDGAMSKQITIIPGRKNLEERIRSKLDSKEEEKTKELTPWEKYQEKRKQKRKDRRQAARGNTKSGNSKDNLGKGDNRSKDRDDFFAIDGDSDTDAKFAPTGQNKDLKSKRTSKEQISKEELELLMAGEQAEEEARDYDIRGIQRLEKNKGKKLKGSRKRKEAKIAADVSGSGFKINVDDNRFNAVLDGSDGRFGIDKTDPNFKNTTSMREILHEQTQRRKNKRQKKTPQVENGSINKVNEKKTSGSGGKASGASALSFLVQKLKSQVDKA
jgi:hypothetical protein